MKTLTIVGAGSVEFTRNILADLCSYQELHGTLRISLHDIDEERLSTARRAAEQVVAGSGAGYEVEASLDRRRALEGARYVVNEIQVGGYAATVTDFEVPRRFGVRQTIADTIGIGGIMRGLRTIPVMVRIADDIAEVAADDSLLLNYANPMAMVPWGVWLGSRLPAHRVVGVCHSVRDTHSFLAETVGIPEREIAFRTAGFNHQAFVYLFRERATGEDLTPRLRAAIDADPEGLGRRTRVELFRRFGFFPTESSEHTAEYVPWFIRHDDQVERFRVEIDEYLRRSDENLEEFERVKATLDAGGDLDLEPTSELASEIMRALETGEPIEVYTNVRNDGLIDGLPPDACVEVPTLVDGNGVQPTRFGPLPVQTLALNRTFCNVAELTVHAALEERRDLVDAAALLDPNTSAHLSTTDTVAMVDALLEAHGDLIPAGIRPA